MPAACARNRRGAVSTALAILAFCTLAAHAQGIPGVVAADARPELVQEGFVFTEGPVGSVDGGLYFSDLMGADKIRFLGRDGRIAIVRENSRGANGLALLPDGSLVMAEGGGQRISRLTVDGELIVVTAGVPARPLMAPNDVIADVDGGIYFTDPGPRPVEPGRRAPVYYVPPGAAVPMLLDESITRPNGLTLTTDGGTLIVADTIGDTVFAFDVQPDGSVANKRAFAVLRNIPVGSESGGDGVAIDRDGRLYVTSVSGVQVFSPAGDYLGTIEVPRQPANVAFSGPNKQTLYITAREGLYRLTMLTRGPERVGK